MSTGDRAIFFPTLAPRVAIALCAAFTLYAGPPCLRGQEPEKPKLREDRVVQSDEFSRVGIDLPAEGKWRPGDGKRIIVPDETGQPVVAKLQCQIGDNFVAILPSGRVKSLPQSKATLTDRPFVPLTAEALLEKFKRGSLAKFKTAISDHYAFVYDCEESFYLTSRDILESLYDGVLQSLNQWKVTIEKSELPLVVLIFRDRKSFQAFRRVPQEMLAYYNGLTNFVALYQDPELSDAAPEFALKQAAYTIAHEGVHQLLHNLGVQQRLAPWPAWLSEGVPEFFCPIKISSRMVKTDGSSMPERRLRWSKLGLVNDLRMYSLLQTPASGSVIEQLISNPRLDADGYAVAWGLTHYLAAKQPKAFRALLADVAQIKPLQNHPAPHEPADKELFVKHFGRDFAKLDHELAQYLSTGAMQSAYRDPFVYQTHYAVIHTARRGRFTTVTAMITVSPDGARKWKAAEEASSKEPGSTIQHTFRTEMCETRLQAEQIIAKLGKR
jgi:hypothetical protein